MSVEDKNEGSNKEERIDERVTASDGTLKSPGLANEPTVSDEMVEKAEKKADRKRAAKDKDDDKVSAAEAEKVRKDAYKKALFEGTPPDYPWAGSSQSWREAVQAELLAESL